MVEAAGGATAAAATAVAAADTSAAAKTAAAAAFTGTTGKAAAAAGEDATTGIRSINLNGLAIQPPFPPAPTPLAKQSLATAEQARPTPVISGQEEVSTNIAVVFLIQ